MQSSFFLYFVAFISLISGDMKEHPVLQAVTDVLSDMETGNVACSVNNVMVCFPFTGLHGKPIIFY